MCRNITKKVLIKIICALFLFFISIGNNVQAYNIEIAENIDVTEINTVQIPARIQNYNLSFNADYYEPNSTNSVEGATQLKDIGNDIIKVIRTIGSALSVIVLVILAIKYMLGSVEEKAQYKKTMFPYVIGCVLIFGITNILAIIMDMVSKAIL